jgi:primosomal protein N'
MFLAWRYFERKTEIYIKLIQEYLQTGKQILYLLPELLRQLVGRLRTYFGNKVAVFILNTATTNGLKFGTKF